MNTYWLKFKLRDGTEQYYNKCVSFSYVKEAFTPYTTLKAIVYGDDIPDDITAVRLGVGGYNVHYGFVDSYKVTKRNGVTCGVAISRGFTALLTENQLPPGMYSNITFNKLFNEYITFPDIEHENNTQNSYIYVKKGASMWDGIANLSYKIAGVHPYISGNNLVKISMPLNPKKIQCSKQQVISIGTEIMTRRMVSKYNMADIEGEYGTFSAESEKAIERGIIRQRHFDLDERFLNNPDLACQYRMMMSERDYKRYFITILNYFGQDINDILISDEFGSRRINAIRINGSKNGISVEMSMYDSFPPVE